MKRQQNVRRRGFTLVEAMVAMTLMALGVALFGTFFPSVSRAIGRAQRKDMATDACLQQLEYWRNVGYGSLTFSNLGGSSSQAFVSPSSLVNSTGKVTFTRVDSNFAPTSVDTGRARVVVTVSWNAGDTDRGTVTMTSLITR